MIDALHIASAGLNANQAWIDSISNNVANMQTIGFKKSRISFGDLVQVSTSADNADRDTKLSAGMGIQLKPSTIDVATGSIKATNNPLDVAIQGNGFLEVLTGSGQFAYTRAGNLHIDNNSRLVTQDNLPLSADIRIPPDAKSISIEADGNIYAIFSDSQEKVNLGQLKIASFINPEALQKSGNGLFMATSASGNAIYNQAGDNNTGFLLSKHLEMSNVDMVEEMTSLVLAQRAYQLNARLLQASDQILETINNLRR